ncbi:MAG: GtrA family protein [Tidjanibacter sp.]|nr:GtrA family protein [Tidjanibacter sp.]
MSTKYLQFILSRALGTGVDTLVLWFFSHSIFGGGYWTTYILSPIISFEAAVMCNFLCSYFWIWRERITHKNRHTFWGRFVAFNLSSLAGFGIKMLFLLLFERLFGWSVVVCNLGALCISGVLNFLLAERLVFRTPSVRPAHELLTLEEVTALSPIFRGRYGRLFAQKLLRLCGVGRLNRLYDQIYPYDGVEGARKALEYIGCNYEVGNVNRLNTLPEGAFITISNHPYGGIDGVILLDMIGHKRPTIKIMVNKILGRVKSMSDNFVTVTPTETEKKQADATTLAGIRACLKHLHEGHPMGFFPAGAVSDLHLPTLSIRDREWQDSLIRLIQRSGVPVVPIRFNGRNSLFYYFLGLIDWRIRLLRLPREVLNKGRGVHRVTIGKTISPEEIAAIRDIGKLREMLRKSVYEMPQAEEYVPMDTLVREGIL